MGGSREKRKTEVDEQGGVWVSYFFSGSFEGDSEVSISGWQKIKIMTAVIL